MFQNGRHRAAVYTRSTKIELRQCLRAAGKLFKHCGIQMR